ncbi:MAG: chemotaxis protein [Pseudomonadota bacterium]|nr:chemotaxis protein [Pseudomonadota bacterium]
MSKIHPPSPIRPVDYEAIEAALMETARGRWFLTEFARRNRSSDTNVLLDAIIKLETAVMRDRMPTPGGETLRRDLIEMSEAIARTRREIAAIRPPADAAGEGRGLGSATEELDAIVEATETATSDILGAAEDIQETAWLLREAGADEASCDRLDQRATDIYTACSFQDITGQRTSKVVQILRYLEQRVNAMVDIWGLDEIMVRDSEVDSRRPDSHLLNGPQLRGRGLDQIAVDDMIDGEDLYDDVEAIDVVDARAADDSRPEPVNSPPSNTSGLGHALPPGRNGASGVVDSAEFSEPEPFSMDMLDATRSQTLFG